MFILFALLFYPIYDSAEDKLVLYILSGSNGNTPSEMAHFNYGIHPVLGWIVKSLFQLNKGVNWYSIALIAAHYISCTIILAMIIRRKNTLIAYLSYAVLFLVFEGYFMLFMDFTASSVILAIAALLYLMVYAWDRNLGPRQCIITVLLFLFASFYRIHSIVPLLGIALPFFVFTVSKKEKLRSFIVVVAAGLCILTFNFIQKEWYTAKKADWPQEEAYRQSVFRFYNEGSFIKVPSAGEKWYIEYQLLTNGLFMDTSFMPIARIDSMYHDLKKQGTIHWDLSSDWKKWFFINNRLFFAALLVFFLLYGLRKKILPSTLLSIAFLVFGYGFLLFNYKAPPYILISSMALICFTVLLYGHESFFLQKRYYRIGTIIVLLLFIIWGFVRLHRTSLQNMGSTALFKQEYAEMAAHPDRLFIGLNSFHGGKFYVWDTPAKFSFPNYLHAESFLNGSYRSVMKRFGIADIKGLFHSPAVLIWGKVSPEQAEHFERLAGKKLAFLQLDEFKSAMVWRIVPE